MKTSYRLNRYGKVIHNLAGHQSDASFRHIAKPGFIKKSCSLNVQTYASKLLSSMRYFVCPLKLLEFTCVHCASENVHQEKVVFFCCPIQYTCKHIYTTCQSP